MTHQQPLGPDEHEYRTEQASPDVAPTGDPLEPESPAAGSQPWMVVAIVLLVVFVVALIGAVVLPLLG